MIYQLHEWQSTAAMPLRMLVEAGHEILRHPLAPTAYAPLGGMLSVAHTAFELAGRHHRRPPFAVNSVTLNGAEVAVREVALLRKPFCTLLRFECERAAQVPKVLLVAPLAGHFAAQLRDMIRPLLHAHDVYVTDWADARDVPLSEGSFNLEDYVGYLREFLRFLGPDVHVIAICQGTVAVLEVAALMAEDADRAAPRSMILLGGPVDTGANPTAIDRFATNHVLSWFERTQIAVVPSHYPGVGRRVHPGFLQRTTFLAVNAERMAKLNLRLLNARLSGDREAVAQCERFYEEYFSVMDLPAEFYLQTVQLVFQEHALPKGRMTWRGRRVNLAAIERTALMTVEGGRDDVSGRGQTHAAHALCPNIADERRQRRLEADADHLDLFSGLCWAERIYPHVAAFIEETGAGRDL